MSEPGRTWRVRLYLWATRRLYNEFAWAYDSVSWLVSLGQWSRWRSATMEHITGQRVLETGCGTGVLLCEMSDSGLQVTGLDPSPAMRRIARRRLARRGIRVPLVTGIAQALPFAAGAFDTVVATYPAEYILSPDTFAEAARVLALRGRLVISGLYSRIGRVGADLAASDSRAEPKAKESERVRLLAEPWFDVREVLESVEWRGWEASVPILILDRRSTGLADGCESCSRGVSQTPSCTTSVGIPS